MRQTYLCDSCKQMGIRTSKAMLFEPFNCPKCKKTTTLFLKSSKSNQPDEPVESVCPVVPPDEPVSPVVPPDEPVSPVVPPDEPVNKLINHRVKPNPNVPETVTSGTTGTELINNRLFYFRDFIFFMFGFIICLLIMKK